MRGHEASGTKYVPQELMDLWAAKDPRKLLFKENAILTDAFDTKLRRILKKKLMRV
jgi:2-oxoisovalerate dehydrogenase E1 component